MVLSLQDYFKFKVYQYRFYDVKIEIFTGSFSAAEDSL